jgi:hypothetical protein
MLSASETNLTQNQQDQAVQFLRQGRVAEQMALRLTDVPRGDKESPKALPEIQGQRACGPGG